MPENKPVTAPDWTDPDDAPDLSSAEYQAKFAAVPVRRGRPKAETTKVHIGFRLAADVVKSVKASGAGYNARVEQALRKAGFGAAAKKRAAKKVAADHNLPGREVMTTVYIEARPKGRQEGSAIEDYVVEEQGDRVLKTFKTQAEAIAWAKSEGHSPHVARVRHLNDKKTPDHWRLVS